MPSIQNLNIPFETVFQGMRSALLNLVKITLTEKFNDKVPNSQCQKNKMTKSWRAWHQDYPHLYPYENGHLL